MIMRHFLSCQISRFAAMFGVEDHHYRFLDAKREDDVRGEEHGFSLRSKPYSVKGSAT